MIDFISKNPYSEACCLASSVCVFYCFFPCESEVAQSCLIRCNPVDCSPPDSSVHGILQARILECVAVSFSRGSSWPRDQTQVSHIAGRCKQMLWPLSLYHSVIRKDAWKDFNFLKFTKAVLVAQDVISPGECSMCTWEKGILGEMPCRYQFSLTGPLSHSRLVFPY